MRIFNFKTSLSLILFSCSIFILMMFLKANAQDDNTFFESDAVKETIETYVDTSYHRGKMRVQDPLTGNLRYITLIEVHDEVNDIGDGKFVVCADFKDADTDESLDIDVVVTLKDGRYAVTAVNIHEIDGKKLFNYDKDYRRVPTRLFITGQANQQMGTSQKNINRRIQEQQRQFRPSPKPSLLPRTRHKKKAPPSPKP